MNKSSSTKRLALPGTICDADWWSARPLKKKIGYFAPPWSRRLERKSIVRRPGDYPKLLRLVGRGEKLAALGDRNDFVVAGEQHCNPPVEFAKGGLVFPPVAQKQPHRHERVMVAGDIREPQVRRDEQQAANL